nr:MAG TPA: hypothetical protein [Caudoviricetes sp.]
MSSDAKSGIPALSASYYAPPFLRSIFSRRIGSMQVRICVE